MTGGSALHHDGGTLGDPLGLAARLNPRQLEAAITTEGPLLVLAGAGSGKTRVLVHRIAHLVATGLARPREILAVTFTNKAAAEMRARLEQLLGPRVRDAWIGTFHAMSGRILRRDADKLGFTPSFSIYDTDDARRLMKRVMESLGMELDGRGVSVSTVLQEIDRAKNHGLEPAELERQHNPYLVPAQAAARRAYPRYQAELRRANAMDFGDLLLRALELLRGHPDVAERYALRFRYVLVDEFQDTNRVQLELLRHLTKVHKNLAVVGDDDQSIYRWRGAEVANILGFSEGFAGAKVVKLEQNYRSTGNILAAANAIIARNKKRLGKTLFTDAQAGLPIGVAMLATGDEEAYLVGATIAARIRNGDSPSDFAILYRQNAQSRSFEEAFRRERVPYTIVGGTGFYERREIKDLLAYLRLVANPASIEDLERVINVPPRKIGDVTLAKLRQAAAENGVGGVDALRLPKAVLEGVGLKGKTLEALRGLASLLGGLSERARVAPAHEVARALVEQLEYLDYLEKDDPASAEDRIANVEELVSSIAEHEAQLAAEAGADVVEDLGDEDGELGLAGARTPLEDFLDRAALVSTNDVASAEGAVTMLTIHAAKGLEFKVVYLVGMEELTFPSRRAVEGTADDLEEERRLCYVAVTRAMVELNCLAARFRRIYGTEEVRRPSRFLGELPDALVTTFGQSARPGGGARSPAGRADVVYDDDDPPRSPTGYGGGRPMVRRAAEPERDETPVRRVEANGFQVGDRVLHNSFGVGVVEGVSGEGARAHLNIRFPTEGIRTVVARFVRPAETSC
jgi:DNA helicase-2/ATP-dependent DNA helicase PcrA